MPSSESHASHGDAVQAERGRDGRNQDGRNRDGQGQDRFVQVVIHAALAVVTGLVSYTAQGAGGLTHPPVAWPYVDWLYLVPLVATLAVGPGAGAVWTILCAGSIVGIHGPGMEIPEDPWPLLHRLGILCAITFAGVCFVHARRREARRFEREILRRSRAEEAARNADRAKGEFLTDMSHEIRTPLNAVIGLADLLSRSSLTPEHRRSVEVINASAETVLSLINDILDLSKIEANKLSLNAEPFDLRAVLSRAFELLEGRATSRGLTLRLEIPADIPPRVVGDSGRLRQVILNLTGNAIKFTPQGKVSLTVRRLEKGPTPRAGEAPRTSSDTWLRFAIQDTGPGIAPEDQQRIFESFIQADTAKGSPGGTGLGLAISNKLVQLMGGALNVDSEAGIGSSFYFELPFPIPEGPPGTEPAGTEPAGTEPAPRISRIARPGDTDPADPVPMEVPFTLQSPSGVIAAHPPTQDAETRTSEVERTRRVLVVDDNVTNRLVARRQLEALGYRVVAVASGVEALERLESDPFDAVLMDCQMPHMDGYETTRRLRQRESGETRQLVVAVTAHAMKGERQRCLDAGMDDYLSKPYRSEDLAAILEQWLAAPRSGEPSAALDSERIDSLKRLGQKSGKDVLGEVIQSYRERGWELLDDMRCAARDGETELLVNAAHSLAGSSGVLGASSVVEPCAALEKLADGRIPKDAEARIQTIEVAFQAILAALEEARP